MARSTTTEPIHILHADRTRWLFGVIGLLVAVQLGAPGLFGWLLPNLVPAVPLFIAALALYLLPGLALLRWLGPADQALIERICWAVGLSVAIIPLLLLASDLIGLRWNVPLAWLLIGGCALAVAWPRPGEPWLRRPVLTLDPSAGLLLALTTIILLVRLYIVRDLVAGQFGDSYHHTLIAQLFAQNGGLFRSWQPYVPLSTFTYHFGFHAMSVWLHWLAGVPIPLAIVLTGQILISLSAPVLYLFTLHLFGSRPAALGAAFAVGMLSFFPSYYVNWGRYTQLAGQVVLPVACVAWMLLLDRAVRPDAALRTLLRPALLTVLLTAGLALSHYRVSVLALLFVFIYALFVLISTVRRPMLLVRLSLTGALAGSVTVLLTVPWLLRVREGAVLRLAQYYLSTSTDISNAFSAPDLQRTLANGMLPLAIIGVLSLLWLRQWRVLIMIAWALLAWIVAHPHIIGLNGSGIVSGFAVILAGYLLLAPLAGAGIAALLHLLQHWLRRWPAAAIGVPTLLLAGGLIWGINFQARLLDPFFTLFTPADAQASAWIKRETPPDSLFFVNSFPAYGDTVYAGSDGGWWLAFSADRKTNLEPMAIGFEALGDNAYYQTVLDRNRQVLMHPVDSPAAVAALRAWGYSYLYDGPAANPPFEYVDPARLAASPLYELVYAQDGVTIWRIR